MLIWSATENTVTIMCASIPVLRPLYVRFRYGSKGDSSGSGSAGAGLSGGAAGGRRNSSYKLPLYGNNSSARRHRDKAYTLGSSAGEEEGDLEHGATKTTIKTGPDQHNNRTVITYNADNASDESILRDTRITQGTGTAVGTTGIMRTDQVHVTYERGNGGSKLEL